jgi:hypothetical protein
MFGRPADGIEEAKAERILACHRWPLTSTSGRAVCGRRGRNVRRGLSREDVEALACEVYRWQDHGDDEDPHWIVGE